MPRGCKMRAPRELTPSVDQEMSEYLAHQGKIFSHWEETHMVSHPRKIHKHSQLCRSLSYHAYTQNLQTQRSEQMAFIVLSSSIDETKDKSFGDNQNL